MTVTSLQCPSCGEGDAVLGVIERGLYDGVLFWECERDGERWHRWPVDHWLWHKAQPFVRSHAQHDDDER